MTKKSKRARKPLVNLPPFPWDTHMVTIAGKRVRLAVPDLEAGMIADDTKCARDKDGNAVQRMVRIWRVKAPAIHRTLNQSGHKAMLDYVETSEAIYASGGTSDPSGGGGGSGPRGPSLSKVIAAERLRRMNEALDGREVVLVVHGDDPKKMRAIHVPFRNIARWVAIDGASRAEIVRKVGAPPKSEVAHDRLTIAISEVFHRLAVCCGYERDRDAIR